MKKKAHLAIDLGASSGRIIIGTYEANKIQLEEIHRFSNDPVYLGERLYWDFLRIFHEIKVGLKKAGIREGLEVKTIGIDTWGVDGGWLDHEGRLITYPAHYRDNRVEKTNEDFYQHITDEELYDITGIQKLPFNTVYQLFYDASCDKVARQFGDKWLFIPDLIGYFLTGVIRNEYTIASTGALLDVKKKSYSAELFEKLGLSLHKMQPIIQPGEVLGKLSLEIEKEVGLKDVEVIAVGSHDTASAVVATPLEGDDEVYLCCGTWCLMGMELSEPCTDETVRKYNLTNEGGVEGTIRFLKNINGLWFLQQLKKCWNDRGMALDFRDIIEKVKLSELDDAIDVADPRFLAPISMEEEIIAYSKVYLGLELKEIGDIAKVAYNGLGEHYKKVLEQFEEVTNRKIKVIRMVGGGIQDEYLCQKVADMTGVNVIVGPVEASCIGNILMQLRGSGEVGSLKEARKIVKESFEQITYLPRSTNSIRE